MSEPIWKRERAKRFVPQPGESYRNVSGGSYQCLSAYENFSGRFVNTESGWSFLAKGINRYSDGSIDWDYSKWGHFLTEERMEALRCES